MPCFLIILRKCDRMQGDEGSGLSYPQKFFFDFAFKTMYFGAF